MDIENDRVLKLIFPNGVPGNIESSVLSDYLRKLGSYKVDQLKKEQSRLEEENKAIVEQTQDLVISNYKTFFQTSECSKEIFKEFQHTGKRVDALIEQIPQFSGKCEQFLNTTADINAERTINSITLKKHDQLLEILEMPQLMNTCISQKRYEEALELAAHVQKMGQKYNDIPIINSIVESIEFSWHTMLVQLLEQLRTDLQLPKCLQVIGYLRRMQAFGNTELKLKFLQSRDAWLTNLLNAVPKDDAQQHLTKIIELTRVNLFNITTQYKAIFPDEEIHLSLKADLISPDSNRLFNSWLHRKIENFLVVLEEDLNRGIQSLDTVLGQCMYFGLSFSRIGADFRALMAPIFSRTIFKHFIKQITKINKQFDDDMNNYTLINKITSGINRRKSSAGTTDNYAAPETLLDFHPLATLCNGYLTTLNDLRLCAPISLADDVTKSLQISLKSVAENILKFYWQEQQDFTGFEKDSFTKLCSCFAYDLIPYLQRCIHAIFPQSTLTSYLGISLTMLQKERLTFFNHEIILEPLKKLLPDKLDAIIMQSQEPVEKANKAESVIVEESQN